MRKRAGEPGEWAVPHQGAQTRHGMLLVGTRRGGKARPPETQIVPKSAWSMRRRLRGVQLGHPSAATGGGEARSHTLVAPKLGPYLWRQLSRPTQLGTAAIGELNYL